MQNDFQELVRYVFGFLYEVVSIFAKSVLSEKGEGVKQGKVHVII